MLEREIEAYLIKRVRQLGGDTRKVAWTGRAGAPDRLVLLEGKIFWIELKSSTGKVTPHQAREIEILKRHGQDVSVVASKEAVDETLRTRTANPERLK